MNTHRHYRIKSYKITINVAFGTFDNTDFQIQLFSNAMQAMLDKVMYIYTSIYIRN